jgi:SAM-dependent methyltransferase
LTPVDRGFAYSKPTAEDLPGLASLAYRLSEQYCGACRDYHVIWPYLRAVGANGVGPEFCWPRQPEIAAAAAMAAASGRDRVRWLATGSADAGVLALIDAAMERLPGVPFEATVVDRCRTPLGVCRAHADARGIAVDCIHGDLLQFRRDGGFDVVVMHHVLNFFSEADRPVFLANAARWLAPGGRLCIFLTYAPPEGGWAMNRLLRGWREKRIREGVAAGEIEAPEDLEVFVARLDRPRDAPPVRQDYGHFEHLLTGAGFAIDSLHDLPYSAEERALVDGQPWPRRMVVASLAG